MRRKNILFIFGLLLAAMLSTLFSQSIVNHVEGSPGQVTYQFINLGMTTADDRTQVKSILENVVGIEDTSIDSKSDRVIITFDEDTMKADWIVKSLEAHGFTPESYTKLNK